MKRHAIALGAASLVTLGAGTAHAGYTFTNIVDPLNVTFTQALGINDTSTIVGYGNATTFNGFNVLPYPRQLQAAERGGRGWRHTGHRHQRRRHDCRLLHHGWDASGFAQTGGTFTTVNQLGTVFNQLLGINQSGTKAASYSSATDPLGMTGQTALTVSGGPAFAHPTFTPVPLPANFNSQATGVNNSGTVVGFYQYNLAGDFLGGLQGCRRHGNIVPGFLGHLHPGAGCPAISARSSATTSTPAE